MNELTLRDYVRILFHQKMVIILCCFTVTTLVVINLMFKTPQYEATVKMLVSSEKEVATPYYKKLFDDRSSEASLTQIVIVTSNPVLERVVNILHLYNKPPDYEKRFSSPLKRKWIDLKASMSRARIENMNPEQARFFAFRKALDDLRRSIKVEPIRDTNMFIIRVRDYDRVGAAITANVVSRSYVTFDLEQQMAELQLKYGPRHPMVMQLGDHIAQMNNNLSGSPMPNQESIGPASVKIMEQAAVPLNSVGLPKATLALLAFVMSILLGMILAFIFEYLDQTVKFSRGVENVLQVPLLGSIARIRRRKNMLLNGTQKLPTKFKTGFSNLAEQVDFLLNNRNLKSIVIASCDHQDGASTIAANLSILLAQQPGKKVLLVDANYRKGSLHTRFKVSGDVGLADYVVGHKTLAEVSISISESLTLLPSGKTSLNPLTLLDSKNIVKLMDELKGKFDVILFDAPPLNLYREGMVLASLMDATLLVVAENQTRRLVIAKVIAQLKEVKAHILGAVLNGRTYPIPGFIYRRV